MSNYAKNRFYRAAGALAGLALLALQGGSPCSAQVTATSTFTTALQVQGEDPGTEFDDWAAAGIPIADTDAADNGGAGSSFVDINEVQIANDNEFLYIRVTLHNTSPQDVGADLQLGFDVDQDVGTGFNFFGLGLIGGEFLLDYDFPAQLDENFSTGVLGSTDFGGDIFGNALAFPFFGDPASPMGTQAEWAIPLDFAYPDESNPAEPGELVFPNDSFDLLVYVEGGFGDVSQAISYTLAEAPEVVGDFNGDLVVDAADYTVWRDTFGSLGTDLAADADDDLDVDADDYLLWKNAFSGVTATAAATPAPEPSALLLMATCFAAGAGAGRRGRE